MKLRRYQSDCVLAALKDLEETQRALIVAATGAGKTIMLGATVAALEARGRLGRGLILQHTELLADQNWRKVAAMNPSLKFGQLTGRKTKRPKGERVLVGTLGTISNLLPHLGAFDFVAIDEAHHAASPSYRALLAALEQRNTNLLVFGITATPEREDGLGLAEVFGKVSASIGMPELIADGWLVAPRVKALDLKAVRDRLKQHDWAAGEDADASRVLNLKVTNAEVVRHHLAEAGNRQAVYFCADVAHAESLAAEFNAKGVEAVAVHAKSTDGFKRKLREDLEAGHGPRVVTNAMLLTEGFDAPPIACIGLVRGFLSRALWMQALGRASRPVWNGEAPDSRDGRLAALSRSGKPQFLVLDFVGACERHRDLTAGEALFDVQKSASSGNEGVKRACPAYIAIEEGQSQLVTIDLVDAVPNTASAEDSTPQAPRSRSVARALGLTRYFTGSPCNRGHLAFRMVSDSKCVVCHAEKCLRQKKTEKSKAQQRAVRATEQYRTKERARRKSYSADYREREAARRKSAGYKAAARGRYLRKKASLALQTVT